jgi:hypothetical protein
VGHRITRRRSFGSPKQGFEFVYVATDDFTRLSYVDILADERSEAASSSLVRVVGWFALQNVTVERVMADNGSALVSREFRDACKATAIAWSASSSGPRASTAKALSLSNTTRTSRSLACGCELAEHQVNPPACVLRTPLA